MNAQLMRRVLALLLCALMAVGSAVPCAAQSAYRPDDVDIDVPITYETHRLAPDSGDGYDVVLMVDKSSSLEPHLDQRNEACKTLARILTSDCRLAVGYFGADNNELTDTGGFISLGMDGWSVLSSVLDNTDVDYTGTSLNKAFARSAQLFEQNADSENQRMMFLVTDGENYVSTATDGNGELDSAATNALNSALPGVVGSLGDIPVYVIYIGHLGSPANLASVIGADLCSLDASGRLVMNGSSKNKVISIPDVSKLSGVFREIFFSIKNIGYKEFDAGVGGVHEFSVPPIGASSVQIISESSVPFIIEGIYTDDSKRVYGPSGASSGGILFVTLPDDSGEDRIEKGNYQIRYAPVEGEFSEGATVKATVSLSTSFDVGITFRQYGSGKLVRGYPADATISLIGEKGSILPGGEKTTVTLSYGGNVYTAQPEGSLYTLSGLVFGDAGDTAYTVTVDYDGIGYSMNGSVEVIDLPAAEDRYCEIAVRERDLGLLTDICAVDNCTFFASAESQYTVSVQKVRDASASDIMSASDAVSAADVPAARVENGRVLFSGGEFGEYIIDIDYTDTLGTQRRTVLHLTVGKKFDWGGFFEKMVWYVIIFVILLAVIGGIGWVIYSLIRKKKERGLAHIALENEFSQDCDVCLKLTVSPLSFENGINEQRQIECYLPARRSSDFARHSAVRTLAQAAVYDNGRVMTLEQYCAEQNFDNAVLLDWRQFMELRLFLSKKNKVFGSKMCAYFPNTLNILTSDKRAEPVKERSPIFKAIFDFTVPKQICVLNAKQETVAYSEYRFTPSNGAEFTYYGKTSEFALSVTCLDRDE